MSAAAAYAREALAVALYESHVRTIPARSLNGWVGADRATQSWVDLTPSERMTWRRAAVEVMKEERDG